MKKMKKVVNNKHRWKINKKIKIKINLIKILLIENIFNRILKAKDNYFKIEYKPLLIKFKIKMIRIILENIQTDMLSLKFKFMEKNSIINKLKTFRIILILLLIKYK